MFLADIRWTQEKVALEQTVRCSTVALFPGENLPPEARTQSAKRLELSPYRFPYADTVIPDACAPERR
jgi:hypothetical protein